MGKLHWYLGGMLLALSAIIAGLLFPEHTAFLLAFGIAMFLVLGMAFIRNRDFRPDERDRKISRVAVSYSWSAGYILMAILIIADNLRLLVLSVQQALGIIFFTMALVQLISKFFLDRKGDVE